MAKRAVVAKKIALFAMINNAGPAVAGPVRG